VVIWLRDGETSKLSPAAAHVIAPGAVAALHHVVVADHRQISRLSAASDRMTK